MSSHFNWCHGPDCHKQSTQDRIRGVKGHKVLRTRKVSYNPDASWYSPTASTNFFCSQGCQNDFWATYGDQIRAIAPRTEPLETPVDVVKEKIPEQKTHYGWTIRAHTKTTINRLDEQS